MDERKFRHDYINSVQSLKNFVLLVAKGKLDADADFALAIVEEARRAVAFLESRDVLEKISSK